MNKTPHLYMIDHSHVFKNECIWDKYCFQQGIANDDFRDNDIMEHNLEIYRMFLQKLSINEEKILNICDKFKQTITYELLNIIIDDIPREWILSFDDIKELNRYILYRLHKLDSIVKIIINYKKRSWLF